MNFPSRNKLQSGATLVELVMTIVIISIAIAGVVGSFSLITGRSADPLNQARAVKLAQLYMDEIIAKKYNDNTPQGGVPKATSNLCDIGPEPGESRGAFDDVDDYHNLVDEPPAGADGPLSGYDGFRVSVSLVCAGSELGLANNGDGKRIDLGIIVPGGQSFVFSTYKANF